MMKIKQLGLLAGLFSAIAGGLPCAFAADIPKNHCAVIVASRQSMDEVREYVTEHGFDANNVVVYPANNGWLAIGVDVLKESHATPTLNQWKAAGKIPQDSFCSKGTKFKNGIALVAKTKNLSASEENKKPLFNDGRCALIVASRQSVDSAKQFIIGQKFNRQTTAIYPTASGWFAVGIDIIALKDKEKIIDGLKHDGKIPVDSYCSTGRGYQPALVDVFTPRLASETVKKTSISQASENQVASKLAKQKAVKSVKPAPHYTFTGHFSEGLAAVEKKGKWGFINQQGTIAIALQFDSARPFEQGVAVVGKNQQFALINSSGRLLSDFAFSSIGHFHEDIAIAKQNNNVGVINRRGQVVVPFEYDAIGDFHQGVAFAIKRGEKVIINRTGNDAIDNDYDYIGAFRHGLAAVAKNGRWGYINRQGKTIIPLQFEFASPFYDDLARVKKAGKYGYVNTQGKWVIPAQFDYAENFANGGASVEKAGVRMHVDEAGILTRK